MEGERVLEERLVARGSDLDTVGVIGAQRAVDAPAELVVGDGDIGFNSCQHLSTAIGEERRRGGGVHLTSKLSTGHEGLRSLTAQKADDNRASVLASFPLDAVGTAGSDILTLGGSGHGGKALNLGHSRGGEGQGRSGNSSRAHLEVFLYLIYVN